MPRSLKPHRAHHAKRDPVPSALVAARIAAGVSQADLAGCLGLTPSGLSRLETGSREISVNMALRYAKALGITLANLLAPVERNYA